MRPSFRQSYSPGPARTVVCGYRCAVPRLLAAALAAVFLLATLSSPALAATLFTITGRGFGHGVGMSQYGAYGYARHGYKFRSILTHYYLGTTVTPVRNVTLRIMLRDQASRVSVTSATRMALYDERTRRRTNLGGGSVFAVAPSSGMYRVTNQTTGSRVGTFSGPVRFLPSSAPVRMQTANANGESRLAYRGWLRLLLRNGRLRVVNFVPVESYLRGVVPREMPASWHTEALKTQAVAARSYSIAKRRAGGDFDLYATPRSQYYGAIAAERTRTDAAISATAGLVVKYGTAVIPAYFHSSSGGRTENIEHVWGGTALPWARSVVDPYDSLSPNNSWRENPLRYTPQALAAKLRPWSSSNTTGVKGALWSMVLTHAGVTPRAKRLTITGSRGTSYISGNTLRARLGLRSTWFSVRAMSLTTTTTIIKYGQSLRVSGRSLPRPPGGRVALRSRRTGASRWTTTVLTANSAGGFSQTVAPLARTSYQGAVGWAVSPTVLVRVRAAVSLTANTYSARVGQTIRLSGGVSPNHSGRNAVVQWYSARGWRIFAARRLSAWSTYSASFKPTRRGTYYFCTVFSSDTDHLGNVSRVRAIVVK